MLAGFNQAGCAALIAAADVTGKLMLPCLELTAAGFANFPVLGLVVRIRPAADVVHLSALDDLTAGFTCACGADDVMLRRIHVLTAVEADMPVADVVVLPVLPAIWVKHIIKNHVSLTAHITTILPTTHIVFCSRHFLAATKAISPMLCFVILNIIPIS